MILTTIAAILMVLWVIVLYSIFVDGKLTQVSTDTKIEKLEELLQERRNTN